MITEEMQRKLRSSDIFEIRGFILGKRETLFKASYDMMRKGNEEQRQYMKGVDADCDQWCRDQGRPDEGRALHGGARGCVGQGLLKDL